VKEENPSSHHAESNDQQHDEKGTHPVESQPLVPGAASQKSFSANPASEKAARKIEKPLKKVERHTLIIAWAGLIVACITGAVFYRQLKEMQEQTRIQQDTGINTERAWIGMDEPVKIDVLETVPRLKVEAHYRIKNFGHGPALKVFPSGWFWTDSKTLGNLAKSACMGLSPWVRQAVKTLSAVRCFSIVLPLLPAAR
jgi:hypothetical protein